MATLEQGSEEPSAPLSQQATIKLPRVRWTQILAISIFWLALNFHWAALGLIILPSEVFKIAGTFNKGDALAFVLVPGAFVSLFSNPLFGFLSDRTHGKLAIWGRRRPFILFGTLVNIGGLLWMAAARDIPTLAIAYVIVQFSNNAAAAPFHALLPDIVPAEQRGLTSGVMGLLSITGNIGGVVVATVSHLKQTPAIATEIAERLGCGTAPAFDISAACAGFGYGLSLADGMVRGGSAEYVLVIGVERLSDLTDVTDRSTAFIFGDGAGAAIVGPSDTPGIGKVIWGSDGSQKDVISQTQAWDTAFAKQDAVNGVVVADARHGALAVLRAGGKTLHHARGHPPKRRGVGPERADNARYSTHVGRRIVGERL